MIKHIKDNEYESEVINKEGVVLVDFYANWCGPCMMLSPILEDIGNSRSGYNIVKVNVDECPEATNLLGIDTIPTLVIYKNGKILSKHVGLMSREEITYELDKVEED